AVVANLAETLPRLYSAVAVQGVPSTGNFFETARNAQEQLINLMDQRAAGLATDPCDRLILDLNELTDAARRSDEPDEFEQQFTGDLEEIDLNLEINEFDEQAPEPADSTPPLPETSEETSEMDEEQIGRAS